MKAKMVKSLLGVAIALVFATGLVFAKGANIDIVYRGEVGNNLTLAPGNYRLVLNTTSQAPDVTFYKNGKVVGTTPVKVVAELKKNNQTEILYSAPKDRLRQITEIDLNGQRDRLIFNHS